MRPAAGLLLALLVVASGCATDDPGGAQPSALSSVAPGALTVCAAPSPGRLGNEAGTWTGPDAAVVGHVAEELELEPVWVEVSFDELVSGVALNSGRCDLGVGGIVADDTLRAVARPTAPYAPVTRVVVAPGDVTEVPPDEVTGGVGVEESSPALDASAALTGAELVEYPSVVDVERALEAGQVDAALLTLGQQAQVQIEVALRSTIEVTDQYVLLLPVTADDAAVEAVDAVLPPV